jgi:hypothetical protein
MYSLAFSQCCSKFASTSHSSAKSLNASEADFISTNLHCSTDSSRVFMIFSILSYFLSLKRPNNPHKVYHSHLSAALNDARLSIFKFGSKLCFT